MFLLFVFQYKFKYSLVCSESKYVFFFSREKKCRFIHIWNKFYHFAPRVKNWNGFPIRSSVKYTETRFNKISKWKQKLFFEQPNKMSYNFMVILRGKNTNFTMYTRVYIESSHTLSEIASLQIMTIPDTIRF